MSILDYKKKVEDTENLDFISQVKDALNNEHIETEEIEEETKEETEESENILFEGYVEEEAQNKSSSIAGAKAITKIFDMVLSRSLAFYVKDDDFSKFKMNKDEAEDVRESAAAWLDTVNVEISPIWQLVSALSLVSTVKFIEANEYKKDKERREEAARKAREAADKYKSGKKLTPEENEATTVVSRKRFKYDSKGYYFRDESGNYIKGKKPITMKAPSFVVETTERMAKEGKSQADINKFLIEHYENEAA
jgi:transcription antitermination factor NusG